MEMRKRLRPGSAVIVIAFIEPAPDVSERLMGGSIEPVFAFAGYVRSGGPSGGIYAGNGDFTVSIGGTDTVPTSVALATAFRDFALMTSFAQPDLRGARTYLIVKVDNDRVERIQKERTLTYAEFKKLLQARLREAQAEAN